MITVITTIAKPTKSVKELVMKLLGVDGHLVVVGDAKGPQKYNTDDTTFLSLEKQAGLHFKLVKRLPTCHYARKNLGYLYAIQQRANCIYETDDDNASLSRWKLRSLQVDARMPQKQGWLNVFKYFSVFSRENKKWFNPNLCSSCYSGYYRCSKCDRSRTLHLYVVLRIDLVSALGRALVTL